MPIRLLVIIITMLLPLIGCEQQQQSSPKRSGKVVKIGVIAPFSGPYKGWGESSVQGVKTALALKPYLLNGDQVELILEDDQNDSEITRKSLHKLAAEDKVAAIMIFSSSAVVLEIVDEVEKYKIPVFALIATHPEITSGKWVTQFAVDDKLQGTIAALYVIDELLIEHAGVVVNEDDPHSLWLADEFSRKFKEAGGRINRVAINDSFTDFSKFVSGFRGSGLKFLYLPLNAEQVVLIEEEMSTMAWKPKVMVSDGLLSRIQLEFADKIDIVNGMLAPEVYSSSLPRTEYGRNVRSIFNKKFDDVGTVFTGLGCEGTSVLLGAIDRCEDSSDRPCINQMLRSTNGFDGIFGKLYIGANGKTERPVFINMINGDELNLVVKIY